MTSSHVIEVPKVPKLTSAGISDSSEIEELVIAQNDRLGELLAGIIFSSLFNPFSSLYLLLEK